MNSMKRLLTIVAVMCVGMLSAQVEGVDGVHVPTEDDVLSRIMPPDSAYFYAPMFRRYMDGDLSLTREHYFYLYYGYAYEPDYDAHSALPGESVIYDILKSTRRPNRQEALAIIEAGKQNMTIDPFSPWNINMMTFAYQLVGDTVNMNISAARFRGIVDAIISSGTGLKEKSPWHILRFSHAADIVADSGLEMAGEPVLRTRDVYYIQVERNPARIKGYFFDFSRVYWRPYEGERIGRKSRWMFNGTPL